MAGFSIALGVVVLLLLYIAAIYGGLAQKKKRCDEAWVLVEAELKRRYDLVPGLIDTVSHFVPDQQFVGNVSRLRNQTMVTKGILAKGQAENAFKVALDQLVVISLSHPEIKANEAFVQLQDELSHAEDCIIQARTKYNGVCRVYNQSLLKIWNKVVASMFRMVRMELLELMESGSIQNRRG